MLSTNERNYILEGLKEGVRFDGREYTGHRNISILLGGKTGTIELNLGATKILAKVNGTIEEPNPDRPTEGSLAFFVDLGVMEFDQQANEIYKPKKYANEITKFIDKVIKGSKAIDIESLCLITNKYVWSIQVHLTLINNDGNLLDAFYLAAIVALLHYRKPFVTIESQSKIVVHSVEEKDPQPLSIHHIPIAVTYSFFDDSKIFVMDPTKLEEEVMEGRVTFAVNIYKDICYIHKPGGAFLSPELFPKLLEACNIKVAQLTKTIREVLRDESGKFMIANTKEDVRLDLFKVDLTSKDAKAMDVESPVKMKEDGKADVEEIKTEDLVDKFN